MGFAQVQELKPPVQRFVFTEEDTLADLFRTVNELELAGKPPFLKFLGTRGQIIAAEVLVHDTAEQPDPAIVDEADLEAPDTPEEIAEDNRGWKS